MGILFDDIKRDVYAVRLVLETAIEIWNKRYAQKAGFALAISPSKINIICANGGTILKRCFPNPPAAPSAFKRVGTLLVMMCLHPFLIVYGPDQHGEFSIPLKATDEIVNWAMQFLIDTLPLLFSLLYVKRNGEQIPLTDWRGFCSEHFADEFRVFLMWLGNSDIFDHKPGTLLYKDERLARIILATSLILESAYGPIEPPKGE
jgi:hypothetical protein